MPRDCIQIPRDTLLPRRQGLELSPDTPGGGEQRRVYDVYVICKAINIQNDH